MRNSLFYSHKAEYMTRERFKELGLTMNDIGERDAQFGMKQQEAREELSKDAEHIAGLRGNAGAYAPPLAAGGNPFATALPAGSMPAIEAPQPVPAMEVEQLAVSLLKISCDCELRQLADLGCSPTAPWSSWKA